MLLPHLQFLNMVQTINYNISQKYHWLIDSDKHHSNRLKTKLGNDFQEYFLQSQEELVDKLMQKEVERQGNG